MFKKLSPVIFILVIFCNRLYAQQQDILPSVINTASLNLTGAGMTSFDFSLGEMILTDTYSSNDVLLSQGFLQPYYLIIDYNYGSDIEVVQNVSPNGDGIGDFLYIKNIEKYPENKFYLYNRGGNEVFSLSNYNNTDKVFTGASNNRSSQLFIDKEDLPDGTYFFVLEVKDIISARRKNNIKGFIVIKRK